MTREEAIDILSELAGYEKTMDLIQNHSVSVQDALNMAIKALEHPERNVVAVVPCGDTISRQAVLDALRTCYDTHIIERENGSEYIDYEMAVNEVGQLPLVIPKPTECEDVVSREHLLSEIYKLMQSPWFNNGKDDRAIPHYGYVERKEAVEIVRDLCVKAEPPVTPKPTECEDAVSRQTVLDGVASIAKAKARSDAQKALMGRVMFFTEQLPSVTPKQRTGHWVEIGDEPYDTWECDNCGFVIDGSGCVDPEEYRDTYKYCPNCGAKMEGESE